MTHETTSAPGSTQPTPTSSQSTPIQDALQDVTSTSSTSSTSSTYCSRCNSLIDPTQAQAVSFTHHSSYARSALAASATSLPPSSPFAPPTTVLCPACTLALFALSIQAPPSVAAAPTFQDALARLTSFLVARSQSHPLTASNTQPTQAEQDVLTHQALTHIQHLLGHWPLAGRPSHRSVASLLASATPPILYPIDPAQPWTRPRLTYFLRTLPVPVKLEDLFANAQVTSAQSDAQSHPSNTNIQNGDPDAPVFLSRTQRPVEAERAFALANEVQLIINRWNFDHPANVRTLVEYLNDAGISTVRGERWTPSLLRGFMRRNGLVWSLPPRGTFRRPEPLAPRTPFSALLPPPPRPSSPDTQPSSARLTPPAPPQPAPVLIQLSPPDAQPNTDTDAQPKFTPPPIPLPWDTDTNPDSAFKVDPAQIQKVTAEEYRKMMGIRTLDEIRAEQPTATIPANETP